MTYYDIFFIIMFGIIAPIVFFFFVHSLDEKIKYDRGVILKNFKRVYRLKWVRFLFVFYERKKGKITRLAFWFHIIYYSHVIATLSFFICYFILRIQTFDTLAWIFAIATVFYGPLVSFIEKILVKMGKAGVSILAFEEDELDKNESQNNDSKEQNGIH